MNKQFHDANAFSAIIPMCNPSIKREAILHLLAMLKKAAKISRGEKCR